MHFSDDINLSYKNECSYKYSNERDCFTYRDIYYLAFKELNNLKYFEVIDLLEKLKKKRKTTNGARILWVS